MWAIFAAGTSPTIAGSVHINRFLLPAFRKNRRRACQVELQSVNFAGMPAAKAYDGCCCRQRMFSHVGTVSQAVPESVSQVVRRYIKTRLQVSLKCT